MNAIVAARFSLINFCVLLVVFLLYTPKKFVILEYYCTRLLGEELKAKAPPEEKLES